MIPTARRESEGSKICCSTRVPCLPMLVCLQFPVPALPPSSHPGLPVSAVCPLWPQQPKLPTVASHTGTGSSGSQALSALAAGPGCPARLGCSLMPHCHSLTYQCLKTWHLFHNVIFYVVSACFPNNASQCWCGL